jgi:hypothetical protein
MSLEPTLESVYEDARLRKISVIQLSKGNAQTQIDRLDLALTQIGEPGDDSVLNATVTRLGREREVYVRQVGRANAKVALMEAKAFADLSPEQQGALQTMFTVIGQSIIEQVGQSLVSPEQLWRLCLSNL